MAAGATTVRYGNLTIVNCLTKEFLQEPVYDESNTDILYFRFKVRVTGFLHGRLTNLVNAPPTYFNPTLGIYPATGDGSAGHNHAAIRYLMTPRRAFELRFGASIAGNGSISGGYPVLTCQPFQSPTEYTTPTNRDVDNGPKVKVFEVTHVTADNLLEVDVEFEICKVECDSYGNCHNTSGVLSNRWSVIDEVDQNFMTTRTFRGKLRTVTSIVNANSFRNYVVPPLQPGMRRDAMEFAVSEDGLTLAYAVIDREVAFAPPKPATTWRFSHTERISRAGELGFYSEVNVTLGGDRTCDKKLLISLAAQIAKAKILQNANPNGCFLESIVITDEYSDSSSLIHLHAVGRRVENVGALMGLAVGRIGKPIEAADLTPVINAYDRNFSRGARSGETVEVSGPISLVGAWAAYLQSPCSNIHRIFDAPDGEQSPPAESKSGSISAYSSSEIPSDGSLGSMSPATVEAMYTFYTMESVYSTDGMRAHCPVAVAPSLGGGEVTGPTSVFIELSHNLTSRTIRIVAERVGKEPDIVNPPESFVDENGISNVMLSKKILGGTGEKTADNKRIFRNRAEYVYGLDRTPQPGATVRLGINPWETGSAAMYRKALNTVSEA